MNASNQPQPVSDEELVRLLQKNLEAERRSAATYRLFARETDDRARQRLLLKLADAEERHAVKWERQLEELGVPVTEARVQIPASLRLRARTDLDAALREAERIEDEHLAEYEASADRINNPAVAAIMRENARDEAEHSRLLNRMTGAVGAQEPRGRLEAMLKGERHVQSGNWIADAVYGANDGLGAVFGLVAGVAGAQVSNHVILLAGIAGAVASAVSMGSGAFLASKSEREVHEAELARERAEIREDPDEEKEELILFYQLKGMTEEEAQRLADRVAQDEDLFLDTLAKEELGLSEERLPNPWVSAFSATVSTGLGAIVPVVPFFFLAGWTAIVTAAMVSLLGHFLVGAAKSLVTIRSWWASGLEMTLIGVIVGVVTYAVGYLFGGVG